MMTAKWLRPKYAVILLLPIVVLALGSGYLLTLKPAQIKSVDVPVQGASVNTPALITLKAGETKHEYESPIFKAKFTFNAIAPHWKEAAATDQSRTVSIRTSTDNFHWSDWAVVVAMPPQRDNAPHSDEVFPESPIITLGSYFEYKVALTRTGVTAPQVSNMTVTYLDSRPSTLQRVSMSLKGFFTPPATATGQNPNIISRAAWGSPDPNGQLLRDQPNYWTPAYHSPTQVFIHHTVDSNYKSQTDGASLVRAIWQYHTYTLGWGDIGYNYLVDESGQIYEGRAGGDNIDGGHVYGYNSGSMGVALVGCFQATDSTCKSLNNNATQGPSSPMLDSLTSLLAWKMTSYEINPQSQHVFCKYGGTTDSCLLLNAIAGHRDGYPTSCPGDLAYNDLQYIRNTTAAKIAQTFAYSAKQVSFPQANLGDSPETTVTLTVKNTGSSTWNKTGIGHIVLGTANGNDHTSPFQGSNWLSSSRVAYMNETSVPPGSTGSFTISLSNPPGSMGESFEYFRLVAEGIADFNSFYGVRIETRNYASSYSGQSAYPSIFPGQSANVYLNYRNDSNVTWYDDASVSAGPSGTRPVHLATSRDLNRSSLFGSGWGGDMNRPAGTFAAVYAGDGTTLAANQHQAAPGQIVKFSFPITARSNQAPGVYREYFQPIVEGLTPMNDTSTFLDVTINTPIYTSVYAGESGYPQIQQGQSAPAWVRYRNTGNMAWYDDASSASGPVGTKPVHLATSRSLNRQSVLGQVWGGDQNRAASAFSKVYESDGITLAGNQHTAQPGQIVEYDFVFSAPFNLNQGSYREYFQPIVEGGSTMNDPGTFLDAVVQQGSYLSQYFDQSGYPTITRPASGTVTTPAYLSYKNIGNTPWYDSTSVPIGSHPTVLATSHPINRSSALADPATWCNGIDRNRATCQFAAVYEGDGITLSANQHVAQPGQIVKFSFDFAANSTTTPGIHREYFQLIQEGGTTMNDAGTFLDVTVQ
jgi:hypothetical protein